METELLVNLNCFCVETELWFIFYPSLFCILELIEFCALLFPKFSAFPLSHHRPSIIYLLQTIDLFIRPPTTALQHPFPFPFMMLWLSQSSTFRCSSFPNPLPFPSHPHHQPSIIYLLQTIDLFIRPPMTALQRPFPFPFPSYSISPSSDHQ